MRFVGLMVTLGLVACGLVLTGCGTIAKATAKYGDTETTVPYTVSEAGPVAEAVVREFGLKDVEAVITKVDAKVTGANAEDKVVEVLVTPAGRRTAKIAVSNAAGKDVAEQILAEIEAALDSGEPVAVEAAVTEVSEEDIDAVEEAAEEVEAAEEAVEEVDAAVEEGTDVAVETAEEAVEEVVESSGGSGGDRLPSTNQ